MKKNKLKINALWSMPVLGIAAYVLLVCAYPDYLKKAELLNLFLPGSLFFSECMSQPGGLLTWCSTWLTQFFYHPWLGALIYCLMLMGLQWMVIKAFGLKKAWIWASAIVPAMLLSSFLMLGYVLLSMRTPGVAYNPVLGIACSIGVYWCVDVLARRLSGIWPAIVRYGAAIIMTVIGYCLIGAYALATTVLLIVGDWSVAKMSRQVVMRIVLSLAVVAVGVLWPWWMHQHCDSTLYRGFIYTAAFPMLNADEWSLRWPYLVAALFILLAASRLADKWQGKKTAVAAACAYAFALASIFVFRCTDRNFLSTIAMSNALDNQDYRRAADIALGIDFTPTRVTSMLAEIALTRAGQVGDKLFTIEHGSAPYNTTRPERVTYECGAYVMSYNFGMVNYAYRWTMEFLVEYGPKVEYLKYMVRCAIANGQYDVARKHLDVLSRTMFHKDWAKRYLAYLDDPKAKDADPELRAVKMLSFFPNELGSDGGTFETYMREEMAEVENGTIEMLEQSLITLLLNMDVRTFMDRIPYYAQEHARLPMHFQEAVVLFSDFLGTDDYKHYSLDPGVEMRFKQFEKMYGQYANLPEDVQREALRLVFGDTYWYYYFFMTNLERF